MPKVSVIMSVYNGIKFLDRAIRSILCQSEMDFEFIIFDDGSTESVWDMIDFFRGDQRIRAFKGVNNKGLTHRLNQCFDLATGDFIMRMDGDDVSLPHRIKRQLERFEDGVGFVGCWASSIDANGTNIVHFCDVHCRCSDEDIKTIYPTKLCMVDASTMYTREAIEKVGYFDPQALTGESYNYNRRVQQFYEGRVAQEILYLRTVWEGSVMRSKVDSTIDMIALANQRALECPVIKERP